MSLTGVSSPSEVPQVSAVQDLSATVKSPCPVTKYLATSSWVSLFLAIMVVVL